MGTDSSSTTEKRVAALRGELLRVRSRDDAIAAASAVIAVVVGVGMGRVNVLPPFPAVNAGSNEAPRATLRVLHASPGAGGLRADEAALSWMASLAIDTSVTVELRSESGGDHGRLAVAIDADGVEGVHEELRTIAADLAEALEIVEFSRAASDAKRLRQELTRRDELVRAAGEALIRDSREVVRVVAELEQRDERINEALQAAFRFQRAMLAPMPKLREGALSALYVPAEMISGDFYDVAVLGSGWIRLFIADATGHGVAAGLATMFIKSEYEGQKPLSRGPAELLRAMNEQLSSAYQNLEMQFTALCLDVHVEDGRLRYASAAHPGPMLCRGTSIEMLASGGPFIGVTTGVDFPEYDVAVVPGDLLLAFTDGLLDAEAADGSSFGESGIARALGGSPHDAASACAALVRRVSAFIGEGRALADDLTVVALSVGPTPDDGDGSQSVEDAV